MGDADGGVLPMFTRGGPEVPQNRGKSMVEKHLERQQQEREEACLEALKREFPGVPAEVRKMSLESCDWNAEEAVVKIREYLREHPNKKRKADSSDSDSSSESSSSSSGKKKKKSRKEKKSKKDKKEKKSKDKMKKKDKKEKKEKDKDRGAKGAVSEAQFGKYGILKESDLYDKRGEFSAWLTEVKGLNPEALSKWEEKDHFKSFMEDYNTATLPHRKFYDLLAHHREEQLRAAREGREGGRREVDFGNLEGQRKADVAQMMQQDEAEKRKRLLEHMMLTGKLDGLKEQERLKSELKMAASVGDHEKVRQIQAKLAPDDPRDSLAAKNYGFRPS